MGEIATKFNSLKDTEEQKSFLAISPLSAINAGLTDEYYQNLIDFDFISLKINYPIFGVEPLIRDYDLIEDPDILACLEEDEKLDPEKIRVLKLIQGALRLSANVLTQDSNQLVGQLWGRLQCFDQEEIQNLLEEAKQSKMGNPCLRPITASLTTPDNFLICTLKGHNGSIGILEVTSDGKRIISAAGNGGPFDSYDNTIRIWDLDRGVELFTLNGHKDSIVKLIITPDGRKALSYSNYTPNAILKMWDLEKGKELFSFSGHSDSIHNVVITPDGSKAVSASDDSTLILWDLESGNQVNEFQHSSSVYNVAITIDGKKAISASRDSTLKIWDIDSEKSAYRRICHDASLNDVTIAPDGKKAISISNDSTLKLWDLDNGANLNTFNTGQLRVITFTPDGKKAVSGSDDNTLKLWDLETGQEIYTLTGHKHSVIALAITADGKKIASASFDDTIKLWNLEKASEICTFPRAAGTTLVFTSDDKTIAYNTRWMDWGKNTLKLIDLETGTENIISSSHEETISAAAITSDANKVIYASEKDFVLKLLDFKMGSETTISTGHEQKVSTVAITLDERKAVTASLDGTLKLWDLETANEICTFSGDSYIWCCAISSDFTIVAGDKFGQVYFLRLEGEI